MRHAKNVCKELIAAQLNEAYIQIEWKNGGKLHRVLSGPFNTEAHAELYNKI